MPFSLPLGDRTPITLSKKNNNNQDDEENDIIGTKGPETLYKAAKSLMKANQGATISIAGMGNLQTTEQAGPGKHGYEVEKPKGHAGYVHSAFELKPGGAGKKVLANNFFVPLAGPKGLVGPLLHCWRCVHKTVHAKIAPQKPFVITSKTLHLLKGQPFLLGGPSSVAATEVTAA